ncbi:cytochrome P450 [Novosphingopyxis sp.]|uniref:cytochrome P450 n=1 Tax=Novosphingopyxis sp. TaxID=2709690 RepID=UPI003B59CC4B
MLANHPVAELPDIQAWGVFRYEDINHILRNDGDPFSIERRFDRMPEEQREVYFATGTLVGIDPPRHTRLRSLAGQAFRPNVIEGLRPYAERTSAALFDKVLPRGEFNFLTDYATPLPQAMITEMMGVPDDDRELYYGLTRDIENSMSHYIGMPVSDEQLALGKKAYNQLCALFDPIFEDRRKNPRKDMMTGLIKAEADGEKLTQWELQKMAIFAYFAAFQTTQGLLSNSLVILDKNRDQLEKLRENPDLIPKAIDEILRYRAPAPVITRMTTADVELRGKTIPKGSMALLFLNAANHDPSVFPDPHEFDVERPNAARHLAFAIGAHFCLGAALARLEGQVFLQHWLKRVKDFEIMDKGPLDWEPENINVLTLRNLQVRVETFAQETA